ncbi:MAG TPA: GNAT family N-acetyltransferase [Enteractinococcus sp.]
MTIIQATAAEASTVGELLYAFNTEFDSTTPSAQEFTKRFRYLLERDDVVVLLADAADQPTGFALITYRPTPYCDGPLAQLEELYVQPALRGQGIGGRLLHEALERAVAAGCCEFHIGVDEIDTDARRFYERHGFSNLEADTDTRMLLYMCDL